MYKKATTRSPCNPNPCFNSGVCNSIGTCNCASGYEKLKFKYKMFNNFNGCILLVLLVNFVNR
jgi:hypothetical protein